MITFAGAPPAKQYGGISLLTTEPDATIAHSPIVTPGNITTLIAIQAPYLICTGASTFDSGPSIFLNVVLNVNRKEIQ